MLAYVARVLTGGGYETTTASDGDDALRLCDEQPPFDVYVVDLMMPRMRGDELGRRLRLREPDVKVLYTTGYARNAIVHHGRLDPGVELITKPFSYAELAAKVRVLGRGHYR